MQTNDLIDLTADIVAAHVSNNTISISEIGLIVERVHAALAGLGSPTEVVSAKKTPVVSVRASIKPDYLVCLECGKKQKTLKRHLQTAHGLTPGQYRAAYDLPRTYSLVAPNYSKQRSEMAQAIGLGRKRQKPAAAMKPAAPDAVSTAKKRGRKKAEPKPANT